MSLPQIWNIRQEVLDVHLDVVDMQAKQAASIRVCDQQFQVENNVRQLKSGISVAQVTIRQKKDELDALQSRVLRLSKTLHDTSGEKNFAKYKLVQLDEIRKQGSSMKKCRVCARELLPHVLAAHEVSCSSSNNDGQLTGTVLSPLEPLRNLNQLTDQVRETRGSNTSSVTSALVSKPPRFVSQPPRNLRVVLDSGASVTHSAILLQWDPPIFTGSTPIIDYEVHFSLIQSATRRLLMDGTQRMTTVHEFQAFPPQTTSRWCLQVPVAQKEYWVRDLVADQEYGEFAICAVTKNGKSELSNKVELVKTVPAVPPTKPHFLCAGAITANTISLGWHEPLDDGGAAIEFYEIVFSEAIMQDTVADTTTDKKNFLDVSEVVYKPRRVRTTSNATTFMIAELLSGKEHKDFHVRAVNRAGIPGEFSDAVASIFTIAPGSEFKLLDELQAAVNSRAKVVDSQFLSGFMQRYERNHYILQVSRFIVTMHPEMEAKVNSILSRTDMSLSDQEEGDDGEEDLARDDNAKPETAKKRFENLSEDEQIQERRRQFHYRISDLNARLKNAEYNVQWSKDRRVDLVALIRAAENRTLEKQAELERAKMFTGPQMDSDVLENGLQRFYTKDLIFALEDEIGIEQLYIVDAKSEIIKVENYLRGDIKKRDAILTRLQDRKNALALFEMNPRGSPNDASNSSTHRQEEVKLASLARIRKGVLYRAFSAFVENRTAAIEMRSKVRTTLTRFLNYRCRVAFQHWLWIVRNVLRHSSSGSVGATDGVFGVGSIGLVNAALDRDDLMLQSQELLQQLRMTDGSLKSLVWTKEQQSEQQHLTSRKTADDGKQVFEREKYYPFMLEADAKMDIGDYAGAFRLYDSILNNAKWMDKMPHSEILQLQLKLGRVSFYLKNCEQALIFLNRASFLAVRLGQRTEEGTTSLLIAQVQFMLRSLRLSIESYEHALLCFEAAGDKKGQVACFRGLQCVYTKLEDKEMVQLNKEQADEIEFVISNKLTSAGRVLDDLQKRLVGIGAESSTEITLERVGAIVPQLRTQRIQRKLDISEEKKLISSLEKVLTEKKALLVQGETDLKRALASDTSQVDSSVISGTSARYEIEDFKKKLVKLMGSVKAGEERILKEIANAKIRVSNCEDEIHELEQELNVETGNLMRQMMGKNKLRCFRFSVTNESLKCVVGTASHGVTTCVATSEFTGFLFDLLTGACLGQAVGDPLRQHLGPPRGHQTQIVALYYVGNRIYTGGMDAALGVWEVQEDDGGSAVCVTLIKMMQEFDAAVVSVVADNRLVVCGCSDCDVFVFDASSLATVTRVIAGHERSVMSVAVDSAMNWFTTGGADNCIRVWALGPVSSQTAHRKVKLRYCLEPERRGDEFFNGHLHPVTCLKQVSSEIVSGDSNGRIIIWNLDAGDNDNDSKLLRICDVHQNVPVLCLQFDATRIVSGAQDGDICVTDFATGHLIQTLHGHRESVLDLQFDRKRLMSMSADGKVRLWYWQGRIGVNSAADRKKYHILSSGETLKALSLKYRTSINQLLKWNGLPDSSKLYLGQKLVVNINANNSVAADELKSLDMAVSTTFGKASHENLTFVAANKAKSMDVEAQWASRKLALFAKEYFPPIDDANEPKGREEEEGQKEEESSDSDSDMPIEEEAEAAAEDDGDQEEAEDKAK